MFKHLKEFTQIDEAVMGAGFFQEAKQYSDADEFFDEFYALFDQVTKLKKVMKAPKWMEWMRASDRDAGTNTEDAAHDAITAVTELEANLSDIDREFDRVRRRGSRRLDVARGIQSAADQGDDVDVQVDVEKE